jgi:hypothetical protein
MKFVMIILVGTSGQLQNSPGVGVAEFDTKPACLQAIETLKQVYSYPKRYIAAFCTPKG